MDAFTVRRASLVGPRRLLPVAMCPCGRLCSLQAERSEFQFSCSLPPALDTPITRPLRKPPLLVLGLPSSLLHACDSTLVSYSPLDGASAWAGRRPIELQCLTHAAPREFYRIKVTRTWSNDTKQWQCCAATVPMHAPCLLHRRHAAQSPAGRPGRPHWLIFAFSMICIRGVDGCTRHFLSECRVLC